MIVKKLICIEIGTDREIQMLSDIAELARVYLSESAAGAAAQGHSRERCTELKGFINQIFDATR